MTRMSQVIRAQIEEHSTDGTLQGLPDDVLQELAEIVSAYGVDLRAEFRRRYDARREQE